MVVIKFGGTSIADAKRIKSVAEIVFNLACSKDADKVCVILSAMKGVTGELIKATDLAQTENAHFNSINTTATSTAADYKKLFKKIKQKHISVWKDLCPKTAVPKDILKGMDDLEELLHGISFVKECTMRTRDLIMSFGERLSCLVFTHYLHSCLDDRLNHQKSEKSTKNLCKDKTSGKYKRLKVSDVQYVDARKHIITNDVFGNASVVFSSSYQNIKKISNKKINVFTGFIASTKEGVTTTLGLNGSDYTATLVGAALNAKRIEIWTDVDGVLSADPNIVKDAYVLPQVSYSEAMELSYFGAKVIHPQAVVLAMEKNIPIIIKNTFNSSAKGTHIVLDSKKKQKEHHITGLTSTRDATLLLVQGAGLSGNFYFLPHIFKVFAQHHIKPLMITQSSSEHSICFVLQVHDAQKISKLLKKEFAVELKQKKIQDITTLSHVSIISVIGSRMRGVYGLAGRIFYTMGKTGINVIAIAQGSNEINVSFVVTKENEQKALKVLHKEFF